MILHTHRTRTKGVRLKQEEPMRSHLLHVAVLIAALGVSTSMFAATLA
jgi:hypothetical protein